MFYTMVFKPVDYGLFVVRPLRKCGYKTIDSAKQALILSGLQGYIKVLGNNKPIFQTVR